MTMAGRNSKLVWTFHKGVKPAAPTSPGRFCGVTSKSFVCGPQNLFVAFIVLYILAKNYELSLERMITQAVRFTVTSQIPKSTMEGVIKAKLVFSSSPDDYAIFYHTFINADQMNVSHAIIAEQVAQWQNSSLADSIFFYGLVTNLSSYKFPCPPTATCRQLYQHDIGWEVHTLQKLYEYCLDYPSRRVVYLHNKGSYHDNEENHRLRRVLTLSALSDECRIGLDSGMCDVCSARFSTLPRWHVSGNMWVSNCSHVTRLIAPNKFEAAVRAFVLLDTKQKGNSKLPVDHWVGMGRFADEHWIHLFPRVRPCDVLADPSFVWGYPKKEINTTLELRTAPRWPLRHYKLTMDGSNPYFRLKYRLSEFQHIYHEDPPMDHFIWKHYVEGNWV